jgi:multiple sugar transport system ATP-binding protein
MAGIRLENLTKKFGSQPVVDHVSLEIDDGEFLVIVGPSGCGKTTMLRIVAGLERSDSGRVYIANRLANHVPPKDRDVAMVFQDYALYANLKVYDNLAFGLRMRKTPKHEIDKKVREAARLIGIEGLLSRRPRHLSGGERQRVALGRAIVRRPVLFLLDEPLSNLDALLRVHMRTELIRLHKELGTTVIYVTHDQVEAMTMGSRIAVMNRGKLQQVGTPGQIYTEPINLFVAGFFGSPPMNFVPGILATENRRPVYRSNDGSVELELEDGAKRFGLRMPSEDRPVILGIRPEGIRLGARVRQSDGSKLTGRAQVEVIEPLGYEAIIYASIGSHSLATRTESAEDLGIGDLVPVSFNQKRLHLFDRETHESLLQKPR